MNIQSLGSSAGARGLQSTTQTNTQLQQTPVEPTRDVSSRVSVSKPAELIQKLSDLQQSDPAKFTQAAKQIASKLEELAASNGGAQSQGISSLADAFSQAAQTGDLSVLNPGVGKDGPPPPAPEADGFQGGNFQQSRGRETHDSTSSIQNGGQGLRAHNAYRQNGPPAPPARALDDAFSSALSVVSSLSSSNVS